MKKYIGSAVIALSLMTPAAFAGTLQIPVVNSNDKLEDPKLWKGIDEDEVPLEAIAYREIETPSRATSKIYLQNDRMYVCYESCDQEQPEMPIQGGKVILGDLDANKYVSGHKRSEAWKALKMLNVYYWTNKLFDRLETLGYKPTHRLKVVVERDVTMPTTNKDFTNNAFFNDKDWSLNFLPAKNSLILKLFGMNPHATALDPSVAIHECTHSVFQDLIGDILNPGLFGLHEALADYYAMAVLDTRKIGVVFFGGTPIRSTLDDKEAKKTVYEPGMEAHDSGNIFNTALQHIRALSKDKNFLDAVTLKTVRSLGQSPYILPTHIQSAFINSLRQTASEKNWPLSEDFVAKVNGIWKTYNIQAPQNIGTLPASYFAGADHNSGYFEMTVTTIFPDKVAAEWGYPAKSEITSRVLKSLAGPALKIPGNKEAEVTSVIYAETKNGSEVVPVWAHIAKEGVLGAYDQDGHLIAPKTSQFAGVVKLNEQLKSITGLLTHEDAGLMFGQLFSGAIQAPKGGLDMTNVFKVKHEQTQDISMTTPSLGKVAIRQRNADLKFTLMGRGLNILIGGQLSALDAVAIYTVAAKDYPQLQTPLVFKGERYLGYELWYKDGTHSKVLITDFDANTHSDVLPAPKKVSVN